MKHKTDHVLRAYALIFSALCFLSFSVTAQTDSLKKAKLHGGFGHVNFSFEHINMNAVNDLLSPYGYGKINSENYSWGGGGMFLINRFLFGGEGASVMDARTENATNFIKVKSSYGYFSLGYIAWSGKRSVFYPTLGLGHGSCDIDVRAKQQPHELPQQLNTPAGFTTIKADGLLMNVQLAYLFFFNHADKHGFFVGLKAGYKFSPNNWEVKTNDQSLGNSPKININGFYATITLGGGGIFSK